MIAFFSDLVPSTGVYFISAVLSGASAQDGSDRRFIIGSRHSCDRQLACALHQQRLFVQRV